MFSISQQQPKDPKDAILENVFDAQDYLIIKDMKSVIEEHRNTVKYINDKLIAKLNFKLDNGSFVKVPFIIDINYPGQMSLCPMACKLLSSRLKMDNDNVKFIEIDHPYNENYQYVCNKPMLFETNNGNANYIGFKFLSKMRAIIDFYDNNNARISRLQDDMLYL